MVKINIMTKDEVQIEALNATKDKQRCGIVLGTGVGKTLVGLNHIEQNTTSLMKCLIVAPKKSIFQSWKDDAVKFGKEHLLDRMTFTTYLSIKKHDPNEYQAVYLDECHSLLDNHRGFLQLYKGKILGLTGTPPKRSYSENNILNDYQIIVHQINLSSDKNYQVKMKNKSWMTSEEQNYTYWSRRIDVGSGNMHMLRVMRMKAMMEYPSKENILKFYFKIFLQNVLCLQIHKTRLINYACIVIIVIILILKII